MHKALLICFVSSKIGVGHLSRLLALANILEKDKILIPEFLIFGNLIKKKELDKFKVYNFSLKNNFVDVVSKFVGNNKFNLLIFDINQNHKIRKLRELFTALKNQKMPLVSIDSLIDFCDLLDLIWVPSFNFDSAKYYKCKSILKSGWDTYLIQKRLDHKKWSPGSKVLILTGGSDIANLGKNLPKQLDKILKDNSELHWVRGPFAKKPNIPKKPRLKWIIHDEPQQLDELIIQSNYVISVFGVSFFEVLQYGIPTVVFSPYNKKDENDLQNLSKEKVAIVSKNSNKAIEELSQLMYDKTTAKKISINALKKMSINGTKNLSKNISLLLKLK